MECIIDTNVLVDYILLDSELHEKARLNLEKADNGFVPSVVIEELAHVLNNFKLDKNVINEKVSEVLDSYGIVEVSEDNINNARRIIVEEQHINFKKFNDKLILSIAKEKDLPLLTFDRGLIDECKIHGVKLFETEKS